MFNIIFWPPTRIRRSSLIATRLWNEEIYKIHIYLRESRNNSNIELKVFRKKIWTDFFWNFFLTEEKLQPSVSLSWISLEHMKPKTKRWVRNIQWLRKTSVDIAIDATSLSDYDDKLSVTLSKDELPIILFADTTCCFMWRQRSFSNFNWWHQRPLDIFQWNWWSIYRDLFRWVMLSFISLSP